MDYEGLDRLGLGLGLSIDLRRRYLWYAPDKRTRQPETMQPADDGVARIDGAEFPVDVGGSLPARKPFRMMLSQRVIVLRRPFHGVAVALVAISPFGGTVA